MDKKKIAESIAGIAAERPQSKIIIITDGKSAGDIRFIRETAESHGLEVIEESHADALQMIFDSLTADSGILPDPEDIREAVEKLKATRVYDADEERKSSRRYQQEQMKLRKRFYKK